MRKHHGKALALAAVLMMTVPASLALAGENKSATAPVDQQTEKAMPPGCALHAGRDMATVARMDCAGMKSGKSGCCAHGAEAKCCGMKAGKGGCCAHGAGATCCSTKGGKGACCMPGVETRRGKGMAMAAGMPGCGLRGAGTKGCGMGLGMGGSGTGGRMCALGMAGGTMGPEIGCGPGTMRDLDLTPVQQKRLQEIRDKQMRLSVGAEADLRLAMMDLQTLMRAETPDRAKIDAQIDRLAQLRARLQKSRVAARLEARSVLTPDQLRKWREGAVEDEEQAD